MTQTSMRAYVVQVGVAFVGLLVELVNYINSTSAPELRWHVVQHDAVTTGAAAHEETE